MSGLSVEELEVVEASASLAREVDAFSQTAERWTPLYGPRYLALWVKAFGPRDGGRIVVARDGTGRLVAYAPLMRVRGHVGPVPVPTLRFLGNNIGYPGDLLYAEVFAAREDRDAVAAVLRHVASTWSVGKWELGYLPPSSPTWAAVSEVLGDGFVAPSARGSVPFVTVHPPADWDTYLASLTSNTRSSYRRGLRHLDGLGQLKVRVDRTPEGSRNRMKELIDNHLHWLAGTGKEGWFGDRGVRNFLVASAEFLAREGTFLSATLELNGRPIAWIVGPANGATYFEQKSSYDRSHSEDSPGLVLGLELMRELIAAGFRRVELGPGSTLYKQRLGGVESPHLRALGYQGWARRAAWVHAAVRRNPTARGADAEESKANRLATIPGPAENRSR